MFTITDILTLGSGTLVGLVLGLIGGGGSVLAVPLLVYLVGVPSPHVAIGTSSIAVALSAAANLVGHARAGNVKWPCALVFAAAGVVGAALGSTLGKAIDGEKLLLLFGGLMVVIAITMFRRSADEDNATVRLTSATAAHLLPRLLSYGLGVGTLAGFFGIGGGFLVVPGLLAATRMPLIYAVGSSLVAVIAFGVTTAVNYAISGFVDWRMVAVFIGGGVIGGFFGRSLSGYLAAKKGQLSLVFACVVAAVGAYVVFRGLLALGL